jgi:UDP-3-O-[3-hydroxymyristoyl] glucosamine N-acyltransferase
MEVRRIAESLGLSYEGDGERDIRGVAELRSAGLTEISFAAGRKLQEEAPNSAAGCLIVPLDYPNGEGRTVIRSRNPRVDFARCIRIFHPVPTPEPGIHPSAQVAEDAVLGEGVSLGPHVIVGAGSVIGNRTRIGAGTVVGDRVTIGDFCTLHPNVTVYDDTEIGNHVILHSGCIIGADGFGFVMLEGRYEQFPQVGKVVLEDKVELGANTCVDRAALGVTSIGEGTKIDNMVHIGHNCRIGRHVVVAAQTGFSGGVVVEDYAVIGGQVGIGDKVRIETRATIGSGSGILTSKVVRAGQVVWGTPARPLKEYLRQLAHLARLDKLRDQMLELRKRVEELEKGRVR